MFRTALWAALAFVPTNLDDLFLLVGFFADSTVETRRVVAGQYLGSGILVASSLLCSLLALTIPKGYIRILGLLPLMIGVKDLAGRHAGDKPPRSGRRMLGVTAVTLSCGTDNIAVYAPLFAGRTASHNGLTVGVFAAMVGIWCVAAYRLVNHQSLGHIIRRWGAIILPWILIGLGFAILLGVEAP